MVISVVDCDDNFTPRVSESISDRSERSPDAAMESHRTIQSSARRVFRPARLKGGSSSGVSRTPGGPFGSSSVVSTRISWLRLATDVR